MQPQIRKLNIPKEKIALLIGVEDYSKFTYKD